MVLNLSEEDEEMLEKWVYLDELRWPIKDGCPPEIKARIEEIKELIDEDCPEFLRY